MYRGPPDLRRWRWHGASLRRCSGDDPAMCKQCIEFDGLRWHRYPDSRNSGSQYYGTSIPKWRQSSTQSHRAQLHRYVWEKANGPIPRGMHIHHRNGDKADNRLENLEMVTTTQHGVYHRQYEGGVLAERKRQAAARRGPRQCVGCGVVFLPAKQGQHKFCTLACKAADRRRRGVDDEPRECLWCHSVFVVGKYTNRKYCCRSCSARANGAAQMARSRLQPDG
jgi:hypothetical protein